MQDACCSADCFQFVIRNLKNPQTALWVPGIQQNELQLLGTGIREFLTTSNDLGVYSCKGPSYRLECMTWK